MCRQVIFTRYTNTLKHVDCPNAFHAKPHATVIQVACIFACLLVIFLLPTADCRQMGKCEIELFLCVRDSLGMRHIKGILRSTYVCEKKKRIFVIFKDFAADNVQEQEVAFLIHVAATNVINTRRFTRILSPESLGFLRQQYAECRKILEHNFCSF